MMKIIQLISPKFILVLVFWRISFMGNVFLMLVSESGMENCVHEQKIWKKQKGRETVLK